MSAMDSLRQALLVEQYAHPCPPPPRPEPAPAVDTDEQRRRLLMDELRAYDRARGQA